MSALHLVFVGGTRFIGHAAASLALERGHRVTLLHRGETANELPFARDVIVDRRDPGTLARTIAREKPDVVIDTRAMDRADAETIALAIKIVKCPLVVLSSQDVYAQFGALNGLPAPPPEDALTEDSPLTVPKPFANVGGHEGGRDYDKKDVERVMDDLASEARVPCTSLRLPGVYGARDPKRRFGSWIDAFDRDELDVPCAPGPSLRLTHVHVRDAAHAIVLAATARDLERRFRAFNVGEAPVPTMRERVESFAHAMGKHVQLVERDDVPPAFALLDRFPHDCVMDTSRIRRELGFDEITTHDERLADTIAWARATRSRDE